MPQARDPETGRFVQTKFTVIDDASAALHKIGAAFSGLRNIIPAVTSLFSPLTAALGAIGAGVSIAGIAKIGSEFQDLQIGLAQTLRFMGEGGKDFAGALNNAEIMMRRINSDAAALPGETMDYVQALQLAGGTVRMATGDFDTA